MAKKIAFLTATEGIERVELHRAVAGGDRRGPPAELLSTAGGEVQTFDHLDKAETLAGRRDRR